MDYKIGEPNMKIIDGKEYVNGNAVYLLGCELLRDPDLSSSEKEHVKGVLDFFVKNGLVSIEIIKED